MFTEMIIGTEGDLFYVDSTGYRDEITIKQAIDILCKWKQDGKQIEEATQFSGLVWQYWIK